MKEVLNGNNPRGDQRLLAALFGDGVAREGKVPKSRRDRRADSPVCEYVTRSQRKLVAGSKNNNGKKAAR
ncbi:MAG: hypothetical protein ACR2GY_14630 [Phycisphaerales bacterium]